MLVVFMKWAGWLETTTLRESPDLFFTYDRTGQEILRALQSPINRRIALSFQGSVHLGEGLATHKRLDGQR